jgi:multidrug efflux system outer membrane protein
MTTDMGVRGRCLSALGTIPALLGLCGCAVGADYTRPQMAPPAQYRFVEDTTQAASIADLRWFQVFDDPTLQELIREAIANNLDLQAAVARVDIARAQAGIARSALYPRIDATVNTSVRQAGGGSVFNDDDEGDVRASGFYGVQMSWELDLFGRIRRESEAAFAIYLATEQGRRGVLVTLVGDVASGYFRLRQLDLELDIARRTLVADDETVTYFRNRLDGGVSNRLEVDRIVANRSTTAATIPQIEQDIALQENALSQLLGRPPGPITRTPLGPESLPPSVPAGVPASLLERRPDVVGAEQLLAASNANIGAAKALFFPAISLTGFLGAISGDLSSLLGRSGGFWSVDPGLLQPIYAGGRLRRNLEAAEARYAEALAQYRQSALNAYREVADALIAIEKLAETRQHRETGVMSLQDASQLARDRYASGLASYLEILNADQDLFAEQLLLAQTRGAELQARAGLYRALGGGWQQR